MTDDYTPAEIGRTLTRLDDGQTRMEAKLDNLTAGFVPRGEFEAWKTGIGRELNELKAARAPWWSVAIALSSIAALLVSVIPLLAR